MACHLTCGLISKGTPGKGILLSSNCDMKLYEWCDLDLASCASPGDLSLDDLSFLVILLFLRRQINT